MRRLAAVFVVAFSLGGGALAQTPAQPTSPLKPPSPAAMPAPSPATLPPSPATPPQSAKPASPPATNAATMQFKDEASAQAHCPGDTVVWANLASKVYHVAGTRYYGKTRKGAYVCKQDADNHKFRQVREELVKPAAAPAATKP